ncbi:MAG: TraB/GumN family protein [Ruminococcus sp.]|nr:TraB/GumN family protein [Ruminococcus sp.]
MILKRLLPLLTAAVMLAGCAASDSSSGASEHSSAPAAEISSSAGTTAPSVKTSRGEESSAPAAQPESSTAPAETESLSQEDESSQTSPDTDSEAETATSSITPLMWEYETESGSKVYFLGSMHALKKEVYPLPRTITDAYKASEVLAFELDIDKTSSDVSLMLKQMQNKYYTDGTTIEDHISPEVYEGVRGFTELYGTDLSKYRKCRPWVLLSLAEQLVVDASDLKSDLGLDMQLLRNGKQDGKEIFEVESGELQTDLLINLPDEICEALLASYTPGSKDAIEANLINTYKAWCEGREEFFLTQADADAAIRESEAAGFTMSQRDKDLLKEYFKTMLYDRNEGMKDKAIELIKSGKNVLFTVGLSHFIGDKGIVSLLKKEGYELKQIMP